MKYYLSRGGQQYGPYSVEDLRGMKAQGQLDPADLVWAEGMATWAPVSQILDAAPAQSTSAPFSSATPPSASTPPVWAAQSAPPSYGTPVLAPERGIRLVAYLIDIIPLIVLTLIVAWMPVVGRMIRGAVGGAYWLLRDFNGASLGKMALGLRVVSRGGGESNTNQRIMRNLPLAIGSFLMIIPFGGLILGSTISFIAVIVELILVLTQGERIGDKIAGTWVVKKAATAAAPYANAAGR